MRRVGVVGATAKMGRVVCAAVVDDAELELAAGVLLAVKAVASRPGLTYGLEPLLGFGGNDSAERVAGPPPAYS